MLHIDGVLVRAGDRVVAGETVIAPRPTQLPFESQVDEVDRPAAVAPRPHRGRRPVDPRPPRPRLLTLEARDPLQAAVGAKKKKELVPSPQGTTPP